MSVKKQATKTKKQKGKEPHKKDFLYLTDIDPSLSLPDDENARVITKISGERPIFIALDNCGMKLNKPYPKMLNINQSRANELRSWIEHSRLFQKEFITFEKLLSENGVKEPGTKALLALKSRQGIKTSIDTMSDQKLWPKDIFEWIYCQGMTSPLEVDAFVASTHMLFEQNESNLDSMSRQDHVFKHRKDFTAVQYAGTSMTFTHKLGALLKEMFKCYQSGKKDGWEHQVALGTRAGRAIDEYYSDMKDYFPSKHIARKTGLIIGDGKGNFRLFLDGFEIQEDPLHPAH